MITEQIEVSLAFPRTLWEQLLWQAQTTEVEEAALLIRAVEEYLQREATKSALNERLRRECEVLASMEFDDVGTEEEWLVVQNEALFSTESNLVS